MVRIWLILILFISCSESEDMRMFQQSLPSKISKTDFNIIMSGQSIAQGEYPLTQSGYSSAKINNTSATWLDAKVNPPVWNNFNNESFSPYQYFSAPSIWGCSMEYSLAKYFTNSGRTFNLYKPAWGAQKFGTDTTPGLFHVSLDGNTLGLITQDIVDTMSYEITQGVNFDYMLWMHGESDGRDSLAERNAYETNLRRFISKIRTIQPNIPFLIRQLPPESEPWMSAGAGGAGGRTAINTAIDNVIDDTTNCYLVVMPIPFDQGDLIHPSNPLGNDQMALSYWNVLTTLF